MCVSIMVKTEIKWVCVVVSFAAGGGGFVCSGADQQKGKKVGVFV